MFYSDWTQRSWYPDGYLSHSSMGDCANTSSRPNICPSSPFLHGFCSRHQETGGNCKIASFLSTFHLSSRLTTIRAFSAQPLLCAEFDRIQDLHTSGWFTFISSTRWFGLWLDWMTVVYLACVVYSFLLFGDDLLGADVCLAISSCILLTDMLQWGVRQSATVENLMTSVERVLEYSNLEPEDLPTKPDCKVP